MKFWPKVWGEGSSHQAEKQIPQLDRQGTPYASSVDQGSRTDVKGEFTHIELSEDQRSTPGYEFFLPEPITTYGGRFATQDPATTDGRAVVAGSGARLEFKRERTRAVFSEVLEPGEGQRWETRPVAPLYQNDEEPSGVVGARNFFKTWPSWQNQKGHEHITWPGNNHEFVTSPRGYGPGKTQAGFWMPTPVSGTYSSDVGKDIATAYFTRGGRIFVGAPELPDHIDWRHAAVHTATGGRKFFVVSDTHGVFHVYPVANYLASNPDDWRALPAAQYKSYLPPYPAWVTVPDDEVSRSAEMREGFLWNFNSDATRIVGTPHREEEQAYYVRMDSEIGDPDHPRAVAEERYWFLAINGTVGGVALPEPGFEGPYIADPDGWAPGYWQTPGLVELGLEINVTGDGDMDFEAVFTLVQDSFYDDNGFRYYVDAAYLLRNRALGDAAAEQLGGAEGDLITSEIELFWEPPEDQPRIGRNTALDDGQYEYTSGAGADGLNFEIHPDLPDFDIRASMARAQAFGPRQKLLAYYTVRNHGTQEVIRRFKLCGKFGALPMSPFATHVRGYYNLITYADLRSLSFLISSAHSEDGITRSGVRSTHLYAWNTREASVTELPGGVEAALADTELEADVPTEPFVEVPAHDPENGDTAFYYKQLAATWFIILSYFHHVPVHPHGHWACGIAPNNDPGGELDIIQAYRPSGEPYTRTSHRAEYNAAFEQNRPPDFHGTGPSDTDQAPMATTGIWVTF